MKIFVFENNGFIFTKEHFVLIVDGEVHGIFKKTRENLLRLLQEDDFSLSGLF